MVQQNWGRWLAVRLAIAVCATAGVVGGTTETAHAQSAADKATARQLATEGIKLYQAKDLNRALDKLLRAQALYDAPVHLLYIARCQVELGQLVEGSESYRKLIRTNLDDQAPAAFRKAVEDGERELPKVEPRIPKLKINVTPANVPGLKILVDQEQVSAAVLGVERPANPGDRNVTVSADGYLPAEASVTLAEGESKEVSLRLDVDPNAPSEPAEPAVASGDGTSEVATTTGPSADEGPTFGFDPDALWFFGGLSVGGVLPTGNLEPGLSTSDYFEGGGGGEVHLGMRFLRHFGVKVFGEAYSLLPGEALNDAPQAVADYSDNAVNMETGEMGDDFEITNTVTTRSFGASVLAGTARGDVGGYGELGVAIVHEYSWDRDFSFEFHAPCAMHESYRGPALRLGGGGLFPVHKHIQLTASGMVTVGGFNRNEATNNCVGIAGFDPVKRNIKDTSTHMQLFLGVGIDLLLGGE